MNRIAMAALGAGLVVAPAVGWNMARLQHQATAAAAPRVGAVAAPHGAMVATEETTPITLAAPSAEESASDTVAAPGVARGVPETVPDGATVVAVDLSDPAVRAELQRRIEAQKEQAERRHAAVQAAELNVEYGGNPP